ncbi:MAG: isoprenylcysteine carboxylmethyltransferase family protein [Deltaproteobacteria bacterium]|nr:isoprenylcysteine carboxylmethyltransferase family protein [Deltaproteobacteria bacterium]
MLLIFKNVVFTILVPGTVAVYLPVYVIAHAPAAISATAVLGVLALLTGGAIYVWCIWDFAIVGRATPAPIDPPKELVTRGLYKYSRNPMYVGVLCVIGGWAVVFRSAAIGVYMLCIATVFHLFVILYEEPHLKKVFGPSYEQYRYEVRRWLPFTKHRRADIRG